MRSQVYYEHIDVGRLVRANIGKLNNLIGEEELDGIIINTMDNFRWLTGIPISYVWFLRNSHTAIQPKGGDEPKIIALEMFDFYEKEWFRDVKTLPYYKEVSQPNEVGKWPELCADALKDLDLADGKIGLDPGTPYVLKDGLAKKLPKLEIVDACNVLKKARVLKNDEEIKAIRVACTIGEMGMRAGMKAVEEGRRERDISAAIVHAYLSYGAEEPIATPYVISGIRPFFLNSSEKLIRYNELVRIDTGCTYCGYHSDFSRTVYVGRPPKELLETYEILHNAYMSGISAIKPGAKNTEIYDTVKRTLFELSGGKYQLGWFLGHGIGVGLHEAPLFGDKEHSEDMTLEKGMVFTPEPSIMTPWGNLCIEDVVAVTDSGAELITRTERGVDILTNRGGLL